MAHEHYGTRSKFVYYNSLKDTHPEFYNSIASERIRHSEEHMNAMSKISTNLREMAKIEGAKEIALLRKFFNVTSLDLSQSDLYSQTIGIEIVNSINTALSFKDAYERHLTRIIGKGNKSHAKITAAQFFTDYFSNKLYDLITERLGEIKNITDYTLEELGELLFPDELINKALYEAFFGAEKSLKVSGDWSAKDSKHGYEELFTAIEKFNKEQFLSEVSQAYKLPELKERLMDTLKTSEDLEAIFNGGKSAAKSYIKKSIKESTTAKGTLAEILGEKAASAVVSGMKSSGMNVNYSSKVIGSAGGKADIVMTFNMDMSKILEVVDRHYQGREETVDAYKQLNNYLSKMHDGFIVYTNAKDYSLIKNKGDGSYFFNGFSAGSAISLRTLEGVIANTPGGSAEIIGQIMSTMKGAIWEEERENLEQELCSKMAYLLFDDVLTIGKPSVASSQAIHLTLLDGIYIPLSYLFFLMAEAIDDTAQDARDIFNITIFSGEIRYPEPPWEPGMWRDQKEIAYDQIKISAKFLAKFKEVITGLKGQ